jgi:predicted metal-dependent phosphotriesterase family hydrolase
LKKRRQFLSEVLKSTLILGTGLFDGNCSKKAVPPRQPLRGKIVTVLGPIEPESFGKVLPHEHMMVDFVGADKVSKTRYDSEEVFQTMLPYFQEIKSQDVEGFIDCTPMYLGRDPIILKRLAEATGIQILTNTGLYKEPYLPAFAFKQTAEQLSRQWIAEIENGIENTGIHAGFIKIAIEKEDLKPMQRKIVRTACKTHNATGATIACHSGYGPGILQMLEIFEEEGTPAHALVMVHTNSEPDVNFHSKIAERGVWIEYDNIGSWEPERHLKLIKELIDLGYENQILLSMDRGWYRVGEPGGGKINNFTYLFGEFVPQMQAFGFSQRIIDLITVRNPAEAFKLDEI